MGTWGASPSAFVSFTLRTGHLRTMFGAGHGKVGREMQTLPGKPGTPLNGARRLGGLGATQHHPNYPRVRSLCQSASSSLAQSGGKSWGSHVPRVLDAYETCCVSAAVGMRGAAQKPAAQQQSLLFKACTEEVLAFPTSPSSAQFSKTLACS